MADKVLASLLILLFALPLFFKGGTGFANHLMFFLLVGGLGLGIKMLIGKKGVAESGKKNDMASFLKRNVDVILLILFGLLFAVSYLFSQTANLGILEVGEVFSGVVIFLVARNLALRKVQLNYWWRGVMGFFGVSLLVGFFLYLSQNFDRFAGSFHNYFEPWSAFPNAFADLALLVLPLIVYFWMHENSRHRRVIAVLLAATLVGLILSASKGALLVLLPVLLVLGIVCWKMKKQKNMTQIGRNFIVILVISGVVSFGFMKLKDVLLQDYKPVDDVKIMIEGVATTGENTSTTTRFDHYNAVMRLLPVLPLFGYGPGSYSQVAPQYLSRLNSTDHPHSVVFKLLIENGWITVILFVAFVGVIFVRAIQKLRTAKDLFGVFLLIGLGGFFAHQLVDYNLSFMPVLMLVYFYLGYVSGDGQASSMQPKKSGGVLLVVTATLLLVVGANIGFSKWYIDRIIPADVVAFKQAESIKWLLWYRPEFYERYAQAFWVYQSMRPEGEQASAIKNGLEENRYNANLYALKGDYAAAYKLNPDVLEYLLYDVMNLDDLRRGERKAGVAKTLQNYLALLKQNANFTVITQNPVYAIEIADFLGFTDLAQQLKMAYENEQSKFILLYGEAAREKFAAQMIPYEVENPTKL